MDAEYVWTVVIAVVLLSAVVQVATALWLRSAIAHRLTLTGLGRQDAATSNADAAAGEAYDFPEIAPELVNLARAASNTAIRNEEVHEWHQLDLFPLGNDDISEAVRDKLRRASFDAVAARSALFVALRKHRAIIPASLETELRTFCERLEPREDGTRAERKRRLAADLDALERHLRDHLGADMRSDRASVGSR